MAFTLQNYINQIRQKIDDTAISNRMEEDLTAQVVGGNGARTQFFLSKAVIVPNQTPVADVNLGGYTSTGLSIENGFAVFETAPPLSDGYPVPTTCKILYYWNHFTDSLTYPQALNFDIDQFINEGLQRLNLPTPQQDPVAYTQVSPAQFNVICLYAVYFALTELANRYQRQVDQSSDGTSTSKSKIADGYRDQAKENYDNAEKERLEIYGPRQGQSTVAAIGFGKTLPGSFGWTPPR